MVLVVASVLGLALGNVVCPASFNPGIILCQNNYLTDACRSDYLCLNVGIDQWENNGIVLLHLGIPAPSPPSPPADTTVRSLYSDDQDGLVLVEVDQVGPTSQWQQSEPLIVEMQEIVGQSGMTVLFDIYNRTLWFFGPPPEETVAHIKELGCVERGQLFNWNGYEIDTRPTSGTGCFRGLLCSTPQLDSPDRFQLGFFVNDTQMCFYEPNNEEIDHLSEGVALALLMLYLCLWIGWTESTWAVAFGEDDSDVWATLYNYLPINVDAMTFVYSLQLFGVVRRSHALYSFEALRIIGTDNLNRIIEFFSYGFSSVVVGSVLVVHLHTLAFHPQEPKVIDVNGQKKYMDDLWCTWGMRQIAELSEGARVVIFVGATAVATGLSFFFWFYVVENTTASILCSLYVAIVMTCWANYRRLGAYLRDVYTAFNDTPEQTAAVRRVHLVWLRTATEQLVFQCIIQSIPFDVVGTLALEYHNGIVLAIGMTQLVVCGRDYALIAWRLFQLGTHGILSMLFLTLYAMGVITFSIVFTVVSLFGTAQGVRNRDGSALLLSVTLAVFIFSCAVAITTERIKCRHQK